MRNFLRINFTRSLTMMCMMGVVALSSCNDDDNGDLPMVETRNIVEIATESGYTTLAAALVEAGLDDDLEGAGPFTVFAPTNAAFAAAGITADNVDEVDNLEQILLYHVVSGSIMSGELTSGNVETLNGEEIAINVANAITINGDVTVIQPYDVEATNGVIHTVDAIIMLPATEEPQSIVDIVVGNDDFSILEAALIKAGLVETLQADGPFTVFAPTNVAFENAGITNLDDYTAEELTPILLYHVLGGKVMAADLSNGQEVSALNDADFYLSINDNGVFINGTSKVVTTDVAASNGVIHIVDRTLVPPTQDIVDIAIEAGFTKLAEALTEAGLVETLQGEGPFTVFAPADAAFDALYADLGVSGPAEIDDDVLTAVLTYHVIGARVFSTDLSDGITPATLQTGTVTINVGEAVSISDMEPDNADATVTDTDILGTNGVIHIIDSILLPVDL